MDRELQALVDLLDLEAIENNHYRGQSPDDGWQRVYGGQVLGQALVAASRTAPRERAAHSLHSYFLRPGEPGTPILYTVDRIRDGGSFTTRRVVAVQRGRAIFNMSISFHVAEEGPEHETEMPAVPPPEELEPELEIRPRNAELAGVAPEILDRFTRRRPLEVRPVAPHDDFRPKPRPPHQSCWIRTSDRLPDDPRLHQCALAYLPIGRCSTPVPTLMGCRS